MKRGHLPIRTCRACGRKAGRSELIRWVIAGGEVIEDDSLNMPGRGVYCCPKNDCRTRLLMNTRKLNRFLRLKD